MADKIVEIPGVGNIAFPDSMSDDQIATEAARIYREKQGAFSLAGQERSLADTAKADAAGAFSLGPSLGATVGGFAGGAPGAALGGAAGAGYQELWKHAGEILPAAKDVASNLFSHPLETLSGFGRGAAEGAMNAGIAGGVQGAMDLAGTALMSGLGAGAKAAYRGYLKPSLAKNAVGKGDQIVETALQEALPITKSGSAHAQEVIAALRQQVDDVLAHTPGTVDLATIAAKVRDFAKRTYYRPGRSMEDFDAAMRVADRLDAHPALPNLGRPVTDVSLPVANQVKRDLQEGVGTSQWGLPSKAAKSTEKVASRETRLAIEAKAPTVATLNARESKLIDAARAIDRAVAREANQSLTHGVKTGLSGMVGGEEYYRTRDPWVAATKALAVRAALTPAVASRAAIVASRLGKLSGAAPATVARVAILAASRPEPEEPPDAAR